MSEEEDRQEEKFEFTDEGEDLGYISLDQAQVLAMRLARKTPGEYGQPFANVRMAFVVAEVEETDDHYVITIFFRPEGGFAGRPGREQFFIEKEGLLALRQVLAFPRSSRRTKFGIGLVAVGVVAVIIVFAILATIYPK